MTMRENSQSLVDIISYGFFRPTDESRGAVQGFTHSHEMLNTCAEALPPHTVTPMEKGIPEGGLRGYLERREIGAEDEAKICAWLALSPDNVAIMEREPWLERSWGQLVGGGEGVCYLGAGWYNAVGRRAGCSGYLSLGGR